MTVNKVLLEENKKLRKDEKLKTVADVVQKMTGVGTRRGYYFHSEVRELGRKIREFHAKEIADIKSSTSAKVSWHTTTA